MSERSELVPTFGLHGRSDGSWSVYCSRCHRFVRHYRRLGAAFRWGHAAVVKAGHSFPQCGEPSEAGKAGSER